MQSNVVQVHCEGILYRLEIPRPSEQVDGVLPRFTNVKYDTCAFSLLGRLNQDGRVGCLTNREPRARKATIRI